MGFLLYMNDIRVYFHFTEFLIPRTLEDNLSRDFRYKM